MPTGDESRRALGQAVRVARVRRGWTQEQLGQAAGGMDRGYISDIERGLREPTLSTLQRLADALGLTGTQLFAAADEERARLRQPGRHIADDSGHDEAEPGV